MSKDQKKNRWNFVGNDPMVTGLRFVGKDIVYVQFEMSRIKGEPGGTVISTVQERLPVRMIDVPEARRGEFWRMAAILKQCDDYFADLAHRLAVKKGLIVPETPGTEDR